MSEFPPPIDPKPRRGLLRTKRRAPGPNLIVRGLSPVHSTGDTLRFLDEIAASYDDVVWTRLGPLSLWIFRHPEDIEHILLREHTRTCKDAMLRDLSILLGNGLLTSHGPAWRRHRRLSAPYFAKAKVLRYDAVIAAATETSLASLPSSTAAEVNLHEMMTALALEIVVNALFGEEASADATQIGRLAEEFTAAFTRRRTGWRAAIPIDMPTPETKKMLSVREQMRAIVDRTIEDYRTAPTGAQHLLDRLCNATDEVGNRFDAVQLRDELTTLFLAGHETTALALTFALREVGLRPKLGAALRDEALRAAAGGPLYGSHLPQLTLARSVLLEAMRLYPPAWAIGREVITPFELRGWSLEPGDQLLMPQWLVHRDPRWFTAPRTFAPERWGEGSRGMARPKMSYFPFGGGARVCIGQHFAMVEGTLALAGLCRRIQVHTVHEREVPLLAGITLRPTAPIHVRCTPW